MSDYIDFLLYGSLESSDSDDSDYSPSQDSQSERTLILKFYHNYNIYGL